MAEALREETGATQPDMGAVLPRADETAVVARPRAPRRRRAVVASGVVLLVGALGAAGYLYGPGLLDGGGEDADPVSVALPIRAVEDFDPEGTDQSERPEETGFAVDGDTSTAWHTERYASAEFGNLKSGVGLLIGLEEPAAVSEVVLEAPTPGARFEILGAEGADGQRPRLGGGTTTGAEQVVPLTGDTPQSAYVVWFTELAPDGNGRFWADVGEVTLKGPANPSA